MTNAARHAVAARRHPAEPAAEWTAAIALGGAVGHALLTLAPAGLPGLGGAPVAALGAVAAMAGARAMIGRIGNGGDDFALPRFAVPEWSGAVLTETDRTGDELLLDTPVRAAGADEAVLVLDDAIAPVSEESRVVRLFEAQRVAVPTAGQLAARIDRHLTLSQAGGDESQATAAPRGGAEVHRLPPAPAPDAGAALHAALAELRASLQRG